MIIEQFNNRLLTGFDTVIGKQPKLNYTIAIDKNNRLLYAFYRIGKTSTLKKQKLTKK